MKIKFGAIVTDGRGKIGGHVASKNRAGAYMRTKVTPSNPNTTAQALARGILASLSQGWSGLTASQRQAWNSAVEEWAKTDIFGDIKNPTGLNLYVKLNANLSNVGSALITLPPAKVVTPTAVIEVALYELASGELDITFSDATANGAKALVRATAPLSQGVTFVKSEYRVIGTATVASGAINLTGAYVTKFGTPALGSNIYVSVQFVMPNGQKTVESQLKMSILP